MSIQKIHIEDLTLKKGNNIVLSDISFELTSCVAHLLYGRNGAGKSSLLRCVAGLESNYQGTIRFDSDNGIVEQPAMKRTYLPETIDVADEIIVGDYIKSFTLIYKRQKRYNQTLHRQLERHFEIKGFGDKYFGEISKGMKKMVLLTLSLISESDVIILDEPFEGLDLMHKEKLIEILLEEVGRNKILLLSSHEVARVNRKFDRLISIKEGRITDISHSDEIASYEQMLSLI